MAGSTTSRSGSGGRAGTAGSGGARVGGSGAACTPCIGETVGWGPDGGLVALTEHSELGGCNTFMHRCMPAGDSSPSRQRERLLACMGSSLHGIADVVQAVQHPDVKAALANGTVLFGSDLRSFDGTVFRA